MDLRDGHLSAYSSLSHWERAGVRERSLAHVFDETFGTGSAFNAEVFVAPPHAVAMEFDLFGERRSSHWVKGAAGSAKGNFWLHSALENRTIERLTAVLVFAERPPI
jgi:hypothetical protein